MTAVAQALLPLWTPFLRSPAPVKIWIALFAVWVVFISGLIGSPGVLQAIRLQQLLESKQAQVTQIQSDIRRLQGDASQLEKSRVIQQREIRRVLGYAAQDEIIFDFGSTTQF